MGSECRQIFILLIYVILNVGFLDACNGTCHTCSFSAFPRSDIDLTEKGKIIIFSGTFLDSNCYNSSEGIFVAQVGGVYNFQWKIAVAMRKSAAVRFLVNGKKSGPDVFVNSIGNGQNSVTGFAVVRLKSGDQASLVTHHINTRSTFIAVYHSSFGGFCVSE